jgi:hypothetical protein
LQRFRQSGDLKLVDAERPADIAYGAARPIGNDGGGDRGTLARIFYRCTE